MLDIADRLTQVLEHDPDMRAINDGRGWRTWREVSALGAALNAELLEVGLGEDAGIGVLLRNRPAIAAVVIEIIRSKRCIVAINPMLPPKSLAEDVSALRTPALIAAAEDWQNLALVAAARDTGALGISVDFAPDGCPLVTAVEEMDKKRGREFHPNLPGIAIEMLTSGTTGKPKRVKLQRSSISQAFWSGAQYESADPSELQFKARKALAFNPLVHISGIWQLLYSTYMGAQITLLERFDTQAWRDFVVRNQPKFASMPPSALRMIYDENFPREDLSSLRAIRCGTARLDPALIDAVMERYGIPVLDTYGATEFGGGAAGWTLQDFKAFYPAKRGSVGRANAGVDLRVVCPKTSATVPVGCEGLLEVRSEQIGTREWVRTTDIARIDEDGFVYILGRADATIIRGGFKIAPEVVEATLRTHGAVSEAAVVGIRHERLGELPVAAVQLREGAVWPGDEAFRAFLRETLKPYEIPAAFKQVAEMPRTPSLKISQPAVRALFDDAHVRGSSRSSATA